MQTIQMDHVEFKIPASFTWVDDEGTLVASLPNVDDVVLRISTQSIQKNGIPVPGAAIQVITKTAQRESRALQHYNSTVWYETVTSASQGSPGSMVHFWNVGFDAHGLVISCFVDGRALESRDARMVSDSVVPIIQSIRNLPNKTIEATR